MNPDSQQIETATINALPSLTRNVLHEEGCELSDKIMTIYILKLHNYMGEARLEGSSCFCYFSLVGCSLAFWFKGFMLWCDCK